MASWNSSLNVTEEHIHVPPTTAQIVQSLILMVVALIGVVGNILNLIIIPRVPEDSMGAPTKVLFMSLSAADFLTALMLLMGPISAFSCGYVFDSGGDMFCTVAGFLMTSAPAVSAYILLLINFDRFVQITRPFTYHFIITTKRAIIAAISGAILVICSTLLNVTLSESSWGIISYQEDLGICIVDFTVPSFLPYTLTCFFTTMWLIAVLLIAMYVRILQIVLRHANKITAQQNAVSRLHPTSIGIKVSRNDRHELQFVSYLDEDNTDRSIVTSATPETARRSGNGSPHCGSNRKQTNQRSALNRHFRSLRTPVIVTGGYLLAWLPFTIAVTYASATGERPAGGMLKAFASMAGGNCTVNLFIYIFTRKVYRKTMSRIIICRCD